MYQPNPLETLRRMARLFHVRLHLFRPPYQNLEELDFHLRQQLFSDYDYHKLLVSFRSNLKPNSTHCEKDIFDNWYCAFSLDTGDDPPPYEFAVLGPYRYKHCTTEDVETYLKKGNLPSYLKDSLLSVIGRTPIIENRTLWLNMQIALIAPLITQDGNLQYRTHMEEVNDFSGSMPVQQSYADEYIRLSLSNGYKLEQKLIDLVKEDQRNQACLTGFQYLNFQIKYHEQYHLDPSQALTAMNTILRHAAMEAGVNALRLDDIYVKYEKSFLSTGHQISNRFTCTEMISDYCKLIKQYAYPNFSIPVRKAIDYIDFHYFEDISLQQLAKQCNVSSGYLSSLFHKEAGIPMSEYLQKTRIRHACRFFESTELSIQQIGLRCGFSDASYFTRVFKKEMKISPLQYRSQRKMV